MQPDQNQYNFIMDPSHRKPPTSFPFGSGKNKIIAIVGFLSIVAILIVVAFTVISSLGKADNGDLISVRQQQTELKRVIGLSQKNVSDIGLKNRVANLEATLASDVIQLQKLLTIRKVTSTKLELSAAKNTSIDQSLENAKKDGTYDVVVSEAIQDVSNSYYKALKNALAGATTNLETSILETSIKNLEATAAQ